MTDKINFATPISTHMGYAEMARLIWPALKTAGDVGCIDIVMQSSDSKTGECTKDMLARPAFNDPAVTITNMVPVLWDSYRGPSKNIGYTTFEADSIPANWASKINQYDACWTTSAWNRDVMISSGVRVPIHVVMPIAKISSSLPPSVTSGKFRFFSSFQWSERKNPSALIRAFCAAFNGSHDVQLVIKSHVSANEKESAAIIGKEISDIVAGMKLRRPPDIQIVTRIQSSEGVMKLNNSSHAHISMTHGEGWGLPLWEAAISGRPVIATGWSAPAEWLGKDYPFLVRHNMTPVAGVNPKISPFFDASMNWAEPHVDDAIDKMRYVVKNYSESCVVAAAKSAEIMQKFTLDATCTAISSGL